MKLKKKRLTSARIIIGGFMGVILIGAFLLMLPISSKSGAVTPFINALFTSTSAVCVTGLVVYDTATYWTWFGQFVILLLIQIGGMGVVTIALSLTMLSGRKIGLLQRATMQDSISAPRMGGIIKMLRFILKGVFLLEALGALAMTFVFIPMFGWIQGIWFSIFHSISAFCNAGFDLMGVYEPFSSVTYFAGNPIINITIMCLIVLGGIGFFVWHDIVKYKNHFRKYSLQSKVVLCMTFCLIVLPSIYFYFFDFASIHSVSERIFMSLFQSVTARTAGFNTANFAKMSQTGLMVMIFLMLIGGSPGSTAGGMKTTTFAVMLANLVGIFQKGKAHLFRRRIEETTVRSASAIFMLYITLFISAAMIISRVEGLSILDCMFETSSAVATVGCTMGITPHLMSISKAILIALMYFGRVGALTLPFALARSDRYVNSLPEESIVVG